MPFELTNEPALCSQAVGIVLFKVGRNLFLVYLNGMIAFQNSDTDHFGRVRAVAVLLRAVGVALKFLPFDLYESMASYADRAIQQGKLVVRKRDVRQSTRPCLGVTS